MTCGTYPGSGGIRIKLQMTTFKRLVLVCLAATASMVQAEPLCPRNIEDVPIRLIRNAQIIVPVTINHTGPYDFLLDTGAQYTTVDPALAKALDLKIEGTTGIFGVGSFARIPFTTLDSVQTGSEKVEGLIAVIQALGQIQMEDPRIRGVIAGNFLEHFGLLIDYRQRIVCLDKSDTMEPQLKGPHVELTTAPESKLCSQVPQPTVIVRLSGVRKQSLLLLDSGINVPLLFPSRETTNLVEIATNPLRMRSRGTDGVDHEFAVLAMQEVQVGLHTFHAIQFAIPVGSAANVPNPDVDGLLPTALFRRVYINYIHHYAVLEP
jgi:predicted aspartyl protease